MRSMLKAARDRMSRAASSGTIPARAIASTAASSTCSQVSYFRWSLRCDPFPGSCTSLSSQRQSLRWNLQAVDRSENGGRQRSVLQQVAGDTLHVSLRDAFDAFQRLVEPE